MNETQLATVDESKVESYATKTVDLAAEVDALEIKNMTDLERAMELGRACRDLEDTITAYWDGTKDNPGPCKLTHQAWKATTKRRADMLAPVQALKVKGNGKIRDYQREQEREALERQRKADEEERKRQQELLDAQIEAAKERGATRKDVSQIKKEAKAQPVITPPVSVAKPSGLSTPKPWVGRVVNQKALISAMLRNAAPVNFLVPDQKAINAYAKATKGTMQIPGVEFYQDDSHVRIKR